MNREQLLQFISERYGIDEEHPWIKYPEHTVFRHYNNKKWFALIMDIPKNRLGLNGTDMIDILNIKCDPLLIGTLRQESGFYPAYHMNKTNWITIALDGSVSEDKIKWLLDISFELTAIKKRHTKKQKTVQ